MNRRTLLKSLAALVVQFVKTLFRTLIFGPFILLKTAFCRIDAPKMCEATERKLIEGLILDLAVESGLRQASEKNLLAVRAFLPEHSINDVIDAVYGDPLAHARLRRDCGLPPRTTSPFIPI